MDSVDGESLNPFEAEEVDSVETFEEFCALCEKGLYGSVNETLMNNVQAETLWINDRRPRSMATPISIATTWVNKLVVVVVVFFFFFFLLAFFFFQSFRLASHYIFTFTHIFVYMSLYFLIII
jgi:hypothetical protein